MAVSKRLGNASKYQQVTTAVPKPDTKHWASCELSLSPTDQLLLLIYLLCFCAPPMTIGCLQVQANVQTVLEALGLVDNKTAAQDAKALQEVC